MTFLEDLLGLKRLPTPEEWRDHVKPLILATMRGDFHFFRRVINGRAFTDGWFPRELARRLQEFHAAYERGEAPAMVLQTPPQHGKSTAVIDYLAWAIGRDPENRVILASFSDRLGVRANKAIRRIMEKPIYQEAFPTVRLSTGKGEDRTYALTDSLIELPGHRGSFRNTTVGGAITGESADLAIIDDPIKGREAANSPTIRDKTWDWWTDDFGTRFQENTAQLIILTRWHVDDLVGRIIERDAVPGLDVVSYPAIATADEPYRKEGEPLFPEFKSLDFLLKQKRKMDQASWESLYQQSPIIVGGNIFKYDWLRFTTRLPKPEYVFITADTAQKTKEENDYSVMQAWAYRDDILYLYDMVRGKWEAPQLRRHAFAFYRKHRAICRKNSVPFHWMYIEDKSSGSSLIQDMRSDGLRIKDVQRNTDKVMRARDASVYIEAGQVVFVEGTPHLETLIDEMMAFPNAPHDDTVDPMMDATQIGLQGEPDFFVGKQR